MLCFVSCGPKIKTNKQLVGERDSLAVMKARDVVTLISDSGITQYRVSAPAWLIYDKIKKPCWRFPSGLHLEKFDEDYEIYASVDADSAIYYNRSEVWILMGNVKAMNEDGEQFESERLIVEQNKDRIYTDTTVRITQKDKIINGIGMESNQRLTKYTILKPTGIIPLEEDSAAGAAESPATDSIAYE